MDRYTKSDITRLKNLLYLYRDYIITNLATKETITSVIVEVDESIEFLIKGLD